MGSRNGHFRRSEISGSRNPRPHIGLAPWRSPLFRGMEIPDGTHPDPFLMAIHTLYGHPLREAPWGI